MAERTRLFSGVFYACIVVFIFDIMVGLSGCLWVLFATYAVAVSRARIAEVYDIPLNRVENWCLSLWCNCCVATQVNVQGFIDWSIDPTWLLPPVSD